MDFNFTPEQQLLRDNVARFLKTHYEFRSRQAMVHSAGGWRPEIWRGFADQLGILGASFSEELGGGGGPVESMIVMEEMGRTLAIEPYLDTVVIGGRLLSGEPDARARELVAGIVAGDVRFAFAQLEPGIRHAPAVPATISERADGQWRVTGVKNAVIGSQFATHFIIPARLSPGAPPGHRVAVFVLARNSRGLSIAEYPTVDGSRAADLRMDGAVAERVGADDTGDVLALAIDAGTAALCAEAVGVLQALFAATVQHAKERRQFGRPIGANQALQHRLVDMYMALEQSVSMTCMATLMLEKPRPEREWAVSAAKIQVAKTCRLVGQGAVQIHGAMGMTDEFAVSHYFKRAAMIESQMGSVDHHCARIERSAAM